MPYREGGTLSELHDLAGELEREDTAEGVRIRARVPAAAAPRFERFSRTETAPLARLKPEFAHFAFTRTCKQCTSCAVEHRALPEWKGRTMVTHGSESYYVIGEGLLGESVGRPRRLP